LLATLPVLGISGKLTGDTRAATVAVGLAGGDSGGSVSVCGEAEAPRSSEADALFAETLLEEKWSKEEKGSERGGGCGLKVVKLKWSGPQMSS